MSDISGLVSGALILLVGIFALYTIWDSLFSTVNTSATSINTTMTTAGYTTQGNLTITAWKLILTSLALGVIGAGVVYMLKSVKGI